MGRVVNTFTLVQKCGFMGKNKVEEGLNRKKHEFKNILSFCLKKRSSLMHGKYQWCASILLWGEGAPQPLATHTHRAAGNRTRFAIFFL